MKGLGLLIVKILASVFLIALLKFSFNFQNYIRTKKLHSSFLDFIHGQNSNIQSHSQEVLELFKKAHIPDKRIPASERVGAQIFSAVVSVQSMFPSTRADFAAETICMFESAEGVFRKNLIDSFNPLYWIELLVFLPKNLLVYIGLNSDQTLFRLCNVLLTFIWWAFCTGLAFFRPQLQQFFVELAGKL